MNRIVGVLSLCCFAFIAAFVTYDSYGQSKAPAKPAPTVVYADKVTSGDVYVPPEPKSTEISPEYLELADKLGWIGATRMADSEKFNREVKQNARKFRSWLKANGIPEYNEASVKEHLNRKVEAQAKKIGACSTTMWQDGRLTGTGECRGWLTWSWMSLAGELHAITWDRDQAPLTTEQLESMRRHYQQPIPRNVLEVAAKIRDEFPSASFDVTEVREIKDPFMRACYSDTCVIFAAWDEPGF